MKVLLFVLIISASAFAFTPEDNFLGDIVLETPQTLGELDHDEIVRNVNESEATWKAEKNEYLSSMSHQELRDFFSLKLSPIFGVPSPGSPKIELPESFDARQQWPDCIHPVRNQERCGSCWAFAGSEVLSDRFCIATKGKVNVVLSPEYMVTCDSNEHACNGGELPKVWEFLEDQGTTSDTCTPYTSGAGSVPSCDNEQVCDDGTPIKHFKAKNSQPFQNEYDIKENLIKYGPLETGMMVYADFMHYTGGVYHPTSTQLMGGHAVKVVGWGTEDGASYFIVANSWGPEWGENGFFRIRTDACYISQYAFTGEADV